MKPIQCGACGIASVEESTVKFRTPWDLFPDATEEMAERHRDRLTPEIYDHATKHMIFAFQSFVIETPRLKILVDTCVGEHKNRPARPQWHQQTWPWMGNLKAVGYRPEDIDIVMCTHLHVDHVGWNTQLEDGRWVPTFPNARYVFSETEYRHWESKVGETEMLTNVFTDSVLPVMEAGRADLVANDHEIDRGIVLEPSPGHTPGHVNLCLDSEGDRAVFTGDMIHHPLQIWEPQLSSMVCTDRAMAHRTRVDFLERYADTGTLVVPAHFAGETAGHVIGAGDGWDYEFLKA